MSSVFGVPWTPSHWGKHTKGHNWIEWLISHELFVCSARLCKLSKIKLNNSLNKMPGEGGWYWCGNHLGLTPRLQRHSAKESCMSFILLRLKNDTDNYHLFGIKISLEENLLHYMSRLNNITNADSYFFSPMAWNLGRKVSFKVLISLPVSSLL